MYETLGLQEVRTINGKIVDADIRELDQFNTRIRYQASNEIEVGMSAQFGRIYNKPLDRSDWGINWAVHAVYDYKNWNFKGEVVGFIIFGK